MPEHHPGQMGGTMRLGKRTTIFKNSNSVLKKLYGNVSEVEERHRHRYEVNPKYVNDLESKGLKFVGHDSEKVRMEMFELEGHPYYVGVQFHPEYLSRPLKPSPPFIGFILASVGKLQHYINHGCRLSPRNVSDESSDEEELVTQMKVHNLNPPQNRTVTLLNGHTNGYTNGLESDISTGSSSQDEK